MAWKHYFLKDTKACLWYRTGALGLNLGSGKLQNESSTSQRLPNCSFLFLVDFNLSKELLYYMEPRSQEPTIRIVVKDSHKRWDPLDLTEEVTWHPLEQLVGCVIVQSRVPLFWDEGTLQFKG